MTRRRRGSRTSPIRRFYPSIRNRRRDRAGIVPGDVLVAFNGMDVVGHEFDLSATHRARYQSLGDDPSRRRDEGLPLDIAKVPQGVFDRRSRSAARECRCRLARRQRSFVSIRARMRRPAHCVAVRAITTRRARVRRLGRVAMARGSGQWRPATTWSSRRTRSSARTYRRSVRDLARALKLEKGVLVNDVPEASPAYKSGLRVGDVIVSASGQPVATLGQLQDHHRQPFRRAIGRLQVCAIGSRQGSR